MLSEAHQKVTARHLRRNAYLYIRQSTPQQVLENTESTQRQYALRQRAVALGWPLERVVVIDRDLGHSAAMLRRWTGRAFKSWSAKSVWGGRASCSVWRSRAWRATPATGIAWWRSAALTDTLILDEDGIYDPGAFQ